MYYIIYDNNYECICKYTILYIAYIIIIFYFSVIFMLQLVRLH